MLSETAVANFFSNIGVARKILCRLKGIANNIKIRPRTGMTK